MGKTELQILLIICLVVLSACFSASETAFSSLNRIKLKNAAENGDKKASAVLKLVDSYDRLLSTVLVGNNIVNILASSIGTLLFIDLMNGDSASGSTWSTIVLTVVILIFGESLPKGLAKEKPEKFAMAFLPFLKTLKILLWLPATALIGIKKLTTKLFHKKDGGDDDSLITEDEIITFVEEAEHEGGINEQESELIRSAVEFNDREAQEILTHRVDIQAVSDETDKEEINDIFIKTGYSRLPVFKGTIDNIIGVIHHKDFYNKVMTGKSAVKDIIKPVLSVHKSIKISALLKLLQKSKTHMAVVADDFGGTLGIVTMEDIIEELVGDIWDEHDDVVEEIVEIGENKYRILCTAPLDDVFELFDLRNDCDEMSVGGWVMTELDKIPEEGDSFTYENVDVVVTKTDSRRVLEIEATVHPKKDEDSEDEDEEKEKDEKKND